MFIIINRSKGRVSLDALKQILAPGRFLVLDNLEYSDVVHDVKRHLDEGTISVIYVPRDNDVIDPIEIIKDPLFQRSVKSRSYHRPPPPATLKDGDRFLLLPPLYGEWAGHTNEIAEWRGGRWFFTRPSEDMIVWIEDEEIPYRYRAGAWEQFECTTDTGGGGGETTTVVEIITQEPIPLHRFVTRDGRLATAADPTHVTRVVGIALEEVTIVGKPVRVAVSGVVELSYDLDPGINLRHVYLWFDGQIRDVPPNVTDGAAFCLAVGRAVTKRKIIVDVEPGIVFH